MKQFRYKNKKFFLGASDFTDDWDIYYNLMAKPALELIQYETPMMHFFRYVSRRVLNVSAEDAFARGFVQSFKRGSVEDADWAAQLVAMFLRAHGLSGSEYTFIAVPASSKERHEMRYAHFMSEVCRLTNMNNGYGLVNVSSSRKPVHKGGRRDLTNYTVDLSVAGRKVVLFDDVCTTLHSWTTFAAKLESIGADVVQGVFLAQASSR